MPDSFQVAKLGEYRIIKDIAAGTFGKVKLAEHVLTGQHVAMKFISKANSRGNKGRIRKELKYMRELRHPHIIKLYELLSTETDIIFVLEYAGGELFDYIVTHGKMPEKRARRFFQQIISGIEYSHRRKIVHRDLKPENLLLDQDLNVKIADFGLSSDISDGAFLSTSCGSPNYAAPEVISGKSYAGPEIDVWSCGVILYVMLCGKLPFEDDNVHVLFTKIGQGSFHMPNWLSSDAKHLISAMLVVDPIKRITVPEITQHPFFGTDLPRYLSPLPLSNGPVLGTLSSLVTPLKAMDFTIIEGLGRIDEDIIDELAEKLEGISKDDVWAALRKEDGIPGNAIKVAYSLLKDMKMRGQDLAEYAEQERDAQLAALDPRNALSPNPLSPTSTESEPNPFEAEFNTPSSPPDGQDVDEGERSGSDIEDFLSGTEGDELTPYSVNVPSVPPDVNVNNFAVLNSSLPGEEEQHHLAAYASSQRQKKGAGGMRKDVYGAAKRTKWHFGIRSSSPPMEVMLEIYKTLKALGMEWKEKRNLGGLGGIPPLKEREKRGKSRIITRDPQLDGHGDVDMKAASSIYLIEARGVVQNVVVQMNIQLYMIEAMSYLVDFHHKRTYSISPPEDGVPLSLDPALGAGGKVKEDVPVSPFAFMDLACRLILHLAGYEE